jgi:ABC-type transport system involved in cytochrome bd biosynthesis fused ATPase/permease subunit
MLAMMKGALRYILCSVALQWAALLGYMGIASALAFLLKQTLVGALSPAVLLSTVGGIAVLALARFICIRQGAKMSYLSSVRVKGMLRERIYRKMLELGMSHAQDVKTSEVLQMAGEGVEQLETYFGKYLGQLMYSLVAPLTLFAFMATYSLLPALVLLVCVPLIPLAIMVVSRRARKIFSQYWDKYTDLGADFLESLQGLTTLKIFGADERQQKKMAENAEGFRVVTMRLLTTQLASITIIDLVAYGGAALGILVALLQFRAGAIDLTGCLIIILLAGEFFVPLRMLASSFHVAMNGVTACDKVFALLDIEVPERAGLPLSDAVPCDIEIRGLSFAYGDEGAENVLRELSLELPRGSFVALVGESGCGKSTLCALLCGALTGYAGSITIGGVELRDVDRESLLERVVRVGTNSHIFKGSVAENLRVARADASDEELWLVLGRVKLAGFLRGEQGLETPILEGAANLSGGQRQRLALARALLCDAPVYLFDEATSNIDVESEQCILEVIHELVRTRTVLFISHRLANVTDAHCIYVLSEGRVVEVGLHGQLLTRDGLYAGMYNRQRELESFSPEAVLAGCDDAVLGDCDEAVLTYA